MYPDRSMKRFRQIRQRRYGDRFDFVYTPKHGSEVSSKIGDVFVRQPAKTSA